MAGLRGAEAAAIAERHVLAGAHCRGIGMQQGFDYAALARAGQGQAPQGRISPACDIITPLEQDLFGASG